MKKVLVIGDSFIDKYIFGNAERLSPEAPIPILNIEREEIRGGGAINVANNLYSLGLKPELYTITNFKAPYKIISPKNITPIIKTRYICNKYQLLQADNLSKYCDDDLRKVKLPDFSNYDIVAFVDYNKGIITGGKATIVDTKKEDLSVFEGSQILKVNRNEYEKAYNKKHFKKSFITMDKDGIDYYEKDDFIYNDSAKVKDVIDICGAGDTVMAVIIYCLATGINDYKEIMKLANKAAGIVISKFGVNKIKYKELFKI